MYTAKGKATNVLLEVLLPSPTPTMIGKAILTPNTVTSQQNTVRIQPTQPPYLPSSTLPSHLHHLTLPYLATYIYRIVSSSYLERDTTTTIPLLIVFLLL